jgi:type IV fimbrial biogenesis protein FimT
MKHQRGFTLAELIIVVVIAGVLGAIAAPNMSVFVKNNTRATRVNTMVTALNFARGQAVTRNARVSLCKSSGPLFANCVAAGTGDFANGWIVFTDGSVRGTVDGTDTVLRIFQPDMGGNATLIGANTPVGPIGGLSYENNGLGRDLLAAATDTVVSVGTVFRYCDNRGVPEARGIVITRTGYPRVTNDLVGLGLGCP